VCVCERERERVVACQGRCAQWRGGVGGLGGWEVWGKGWGLGFGVRGFGFWVLGLGFGVWGLGLRVWGLGLRVWGCGFRVQGSGFRVWGLVHLDGEVDGEGGGRGGRGGGRVRQDVEDHDHGPCQKDIGLTFDRPPSRLK